MQYQNIAKLNSKMTKQCNINPLSANPTKWSDTLKQFIGNLPTNLLSVFDHFEKLALKGFKNTAKNDAKLKQCNIKTI